MEYKKNERSCFFDGLQELKFSVLYAFYLILSSPSGLIQLLVPVPSPINPHPLPVFYFHACICRY